MIRRSTYDLQYSCTFACYSAALIVLTMNINPGMVMPFSSKNFGDLSKDNPNENELLTAILKAVENVGTHKITSMKQEVSSCSFISAAIYAIIFLTIFTLFSLHGLRWWFCCLSLGQHVSSKRGHKR
jgi:hypothetical protein